MKRVLIIGGSSFVAKHLTKQLGEEYAIQLVSRSSTSYADEILITDFFSLSTNHLHGIDIVINCAAIVHQPKVTEERIYNRINYELPVYIASKAKESGVKQFLQLSTVAVYGSTNLITDTTKENPTNPYGTSKLLADRALMQLATEHFTVICVRPPMIYGGGNAPGNMMRLIELVSKNFPLPFGNAPLKRDFIYIDTLIRYCAKTLIQNDSGIFLVKDSFSVTTTELVRVIAAKLGVKSRLFSVPNFLLKLLKKLKPSIFEKLFGQLLITTKFEDTSLSSSSDLEKGIEEMVDYFRSLN
jgi:UDP-glucose 4-epimerase